VPGSADEAGAAGYRPLLFSIAYGMTGSVGDAEDIVQDAFLGLTRARQAGTTIADPKAYLTTAVTRLGINYLRSARVRRETYVGDWLPEPVVVPADGRASCPAGADHDVSEPGKRRGGMTDEPSAGRQRSRRAGPRWAAGRKCRRSGRAVGARRRTRMRHQRAMPDFARKAPDGAAANTSQGLAVISAPL
jgi:hypothetical protein